MDDRQQLIADVLGAYWVPGKPYAGELPADIAPWHCYTSDGGHSILAAMSGFIGSNATPTTTDLCPIPVRTVVRVGWEIRNGFVVAAIDGDESKSVFYSRDLGLVSPAEDDEY